MTKLKGVDFKETTTISTEINPLRSLFEGFSDGAILFREKVCEEAAGAKAPSIKKYGSRGISNVFSIAAIEKIRDLAWEVQQDLKDRL